MAGRGCCSADSGARSLAAVTIAGGRLRLGIFPLRPGSERYQGTFALVRSRRCSLNRLAHRRRSSWISGLNRDATVSLTHVKVPDSQSAKLRCKGDRESLMSDREYFKRRAEAERVAAQAATRIASFHAHMQLAREYEWRAATEPYPETCSTSSR
jgi:hypothetical protein